MSLYVFIGPTLRAEDVAAACDAICLPPVAQGDVYRAALTRPRAIGIIDGYFSGTPSVWHKEILWALSQGIHVFGSASMGALRAAELHGFGMRGVGRIFEAFRDGTLEDDDEVAVVHGPAEVGFVAASEPMVNIRATLAAAEAVGVLRGASRRALETFGKSLFFPRRSWPAILEGGRAQGVAESELDALHRWLPTGHVDQKRKDALAMLVAMREAVARPEPPAADFQFEWTHFWDDLVARLTAEPRMGEDPVAVPHERIVEELRVQGGEAYDQAKTRALLRMLAGIEATRRGLTISPESLRATLSRTRAALGLYSRAEFDGWLARNGLDATSLERLIGDQARMDALTAIAGPALDALLLDELRMSGAYERLAERARHKRDTLQAVGFDDTEGGPAGPDAAGLRLWFFEQCLGRPIPDDVAKFIRELGFTNLADFDSSLRRERLYLSLITKKPGV